MDYKKYTGIIESFYRSKDEELFKKLMNEIDDANHDLWFGPFNDPNDKNFLDYVTSIRSMWDKIKEEFYYDSFSGEIMEVLPNDFENDQSDSYMDIVFFDYSTIKNYLMGKELSRYI